MKLIVVFSILILVLSCNQENPCSGSVHAKLKNFSGLDGCGWILVLDDETKLEPNNLSEFEIELVEDKDVHVKFEEVEAASICMAGKIVEIKCLSED